MHTGSLVQGNAPHGDFFGSPFCVVRHAHGRDSTEGGVRAEKVLVNKAVATIAAMGLAGCFLLALAMRQLAETREERRQEAPEQVLQRKFAARIVGPIRLHEEHEGSGHRRVARVRLAIGQESPEIADEIAAELGRLSAVAVPPPFEVVVELSAEGSAWTRRAIVPMR
jgi:hypothetical protein